MWAEVVVIVAVVVACFLSLSRVCVCVPAAWFTCGLRISDSELRWIGEIDLGKLMFSVFLNLPFLRGWVGGWVVEWVRRGEVGGEWEGGVKAVRVVGPHFSGHF